MNQHFTFPKARLESAKQKLSALTQALDAYVQSGPFGSVVEPMELDGLKCEAHKIKLLQPIPEDFHISAAEIAEALRAVLDHCSDAAVKTAYGAGQKSPYFPISDTVEKLDARRKKREFKALPAEILELFFSFEPYAEGNYWLWAVNEVARGSKHNTLLPVAIGLGKFGIVDTFRGYLTMRTSILPVWNEQAAEAELCVVGPGGTATYAMSMSMDFSLANLRSSTRLGAIDSLKEMIKEVERVLNATEAECVLCQPGWSTGNPTQ